MNGPNRHYEGPALTREAHIRAASLNREQRTLDVTMSTGAVVRRRGWFEDFDEALPVDRARLARINSIGVVLDNHRTYGSVADTLGSVVPGSVRVEGDTLVGQIRIAKTERGDAVLDLIGDGHLRAVSLGYDVDEFEETRAKARTDGGKRSLLTPTSWEPYEVSIVQMPADAGATVRAEEAGQSRKYAVRGTEETQMDIKQAESTVDVLDAERQAESAREQFAKRLDTFERLAEFNGVDKALVRSLCVKFGDDNKVGFEILKLASERQASERITKANPPTAMGIEVTRGSADKQAEAMALAISHRALAGLDPGRASKLGDEHKLPALTDDTTRRMRRSRLLDLAEQFLESRGISCASKTPNEIAWAALAYRSAGGGLATTGDFSSILGNAANKMLAAGYTEVTSPWRNFARRQDRPDFKQFSIYRRSGAPDLETVNEHGEIKRASYAVGTALVGQLSTAGIQVGFTRQMLVNDDLDAFSQASLGLGESAVRWEDDAAVTDILYGNPTLNDSVALFHSSRGNIATDVGAPDLAALLHCLRLWETMTETVKSASANSGTSTRKLLFGLRGFFGAGTEVAAIEQILQPRFPDAATNALPRALSGAATWTDPRLAVEASAPDVWFAISNRSALVYGGLQGEPSPRLSMMAATGTDGVVFELIHDFYVAVEDPKAIIRVPKS